MSDIYGPVTEHPEFPVEDSRRFTVTIQIHDFEQRYTRPGVTPDPFCGRCGYSRVAPVHPQQATP